MAAKDDRIKVRLREAPSEATAEFRVSRGDVEGEFRESPLLSRDVRTPIDTLDLEEIGLDIEVGPEQIKELLEQRAKTVTRVFDTIDFIAGDLTKFKPLVPASLPSAISGRLLNSDGAPAAGVRVRVLEPSTSTTASGTGTGTAFDLTLPWPNPETVTDARGAFRLALPPRLLPDDGIVLAIQGGNLAIEHPLRRIDLIAGDGALGVVPLDVVLAPLPTSVLARLKAVVRPLSDDDVIDNPEQFTEPAPVITLGDGDCAVNFRSNSGVIDKFGYSMLVRLVEPELSSRRLGTRVGTREKYLLSASSAGLTKYLPAADLVAAMSQLGTWELVGRVPIEAPIDVSAYLEAVQRNPRIVPKAATLGMGYIVKMHQIWVPNGMSLGDLVYSLPLAPGEQQRIAVSDERETLSVREQEALSAEEFQNFRETADSSTNAVFNSSFNESARGGSKMKTSTEAGSIGGGLGVGGIFGSVVAGLGIAGGYSDSTTTGSTSSWQNASRDYVSNASQDFHSALSRNAAARRTASRTSVRLATATERREIVTKVITNHNHNHALTMQYWQVLRHFRVSSQVDDVQLVAFVPLELVQFLPTGMPRTLPTGNYSRDVLLYRYGVLLAHHDVIHSRVWWRSDYTHALRVLQSFAGDPTMTVQSSSGSAQDVVNVNIRGSFMPFEDVYVTAVATNGARVGPIRMTGSSVPIAAGSTSKSELIDKLRARRADTTTSETRTAAMSLPESVSRSNLARFEFSRSFRPLAYRLSMPSGLSFTDLLAYLNNSSKLDVTMGADELEREISGPLVFDPTAQIGASMHLLEDYNGAGGTEVMPAVMPVAARRLPPQLAFADLLRIEGLLRHVVENTVEYSKAVWQSLTPEERAIMLEQYTIGVPQGGATDASQEVPLLNCVANQVLGYFGNTALMPFFIPPLVSDKVGYTSRDVQESLLRFHRQAYRPAQTSITLPARGVLGEAVLGHCESSEKIDLTRFWNWQDSPPDEATDPTALGGLFGGGNQLVGSAGAQAPAVLQPGGSSMVTINQGPAALSPADLAAALIASQPESNLPQDLTGITQLGTQMGVQTTTTAETLNKTIAEASGLAKDAMKALPDAIRAKKGLPSGGGTQTPGTGTPGTGTPGTQTPGTGTPGTGTPGTGTPGTGTPGTGTPGTGTPGGDTVDGGAAPNV